MNNTTIIARSAIDAGLYTQQQIEEMIQKYGCLTIMTYQERKRAGYFVKKGEKAKLKAPLWIYKEGSKSEEVAEGEEESSSTEAGYYHRWSHLFTMDQVEKRQ